MNCEEICHLAFDGFGYRCRIVTNTAPVTDPVVVLGGAFQDMYAYQRLEAPWTSSATVVSVDLPGSGGADVLPASYGFEFLIGALADMLDQLGLGRVNLFGASYAAPIAYGLAQEHPERVARLALVGAAPVYPPHQRAALQAMADALESGDARAYARMSVEALMSPRERDVHKRAVVARVLARAMGSVRQADIPRHLASTQRVINWHGLRPGGVRDVPALVFTGEHDTLTCPDLGRDVAATIAGSVFTLIRGADHLTHLERPLQMSQLLDNFFNDRPLGNLPGLTPLEQHTRSADPVL
ncbi:alpha/beta fold hydrolase [Streptomyces sp. NPDC059166]|uniref:alpha/beta fold hydrolase n=1 Tax=Streptomyces sp. NPDC059166 TaxID=3346752 RepID=UPI0036BE73D4